MDTDSFMGRGGTQMDTDCFMGRGCTQMNADSFMGRGGTRMRYEHTKTLRIMQMSKNITQSANERE